MLTTPATAPATIDGEIQAIGTLTGWQPNRLIWGESSAAAQRFLAEVKHLFTASKVNNLIAWRGAVRKALMPFPCHKPRHPCWYNTSFRFPPMLLGPTPTINLILHYKNKHAQMQEKYHLWCLRAIIYACFWRQIRNQTNQTQTLNPCAKIPAKLHQEPIPTHKNVLCFFLQTKSSLHPHFQNILEGV